MKENINIAIIGGTGFIGRHFVNHLLSEKVGLIRVFTRNTKINTNYKNISYISGDLSSFDSIYNFVRGQDVVVNLAYIPDDIKANIEFSEKLMVACIRSGVKKILHCSTAVVSGRVDTDIINEKSKCNPITEYEKDKLLIEDKLLKLSSKKIELVIIRPTAVFGSGGRNIIKMIDSVLHKPYIVNMLYVMVNKYRSTHLVPVDTVVKAILFLIFCNKDLSGEKFIISRDNDSSNNYYSIINFLSFKLRKRRYLKIFIPFSTVVVKILLLLTGRSQVNPNQVYTSNKIYNLGFKDCSNLYNEIEKVTSNYK